MRVVPVETGLLMVLLSQLFSTSSQDDTHALELVDRQAFWAVGDTLKVYCRYKHEELFRQVNYLPGELTFIYYKQSLHGKREGQEFNSTFVTQVNSSTAILKYPNLSIDWNDTQIYCKIVSKPGSENNTNEPVLAVRVGYKPDGVTFDDNGIIWYNWTRLTFSWFPIETLHSNLKNIDPMSLKVTYSAYYRTGRQNIEESCRYTRRARRKVNYTDEGNNGNYTECVDANSHACTIHTGHGRHFVLKVVSKNAFGETSNCVSKVVRDFIKPGPVQNVSIKYKENTVGGDLPSATLEVYQPYLKATTLQYEIQTSCLNYSENVSVNGSHEPTDPVIHGLGTLPAYSNCFVKIRCFERFTHGYWSEPFLHNFQTPPAVPVNLPKICAVCYSQSWTIEGRNLTVYFQALSELDQRGECGGYEVMYWPASRSESLSELLTDQLSDNRTYNIIRLPPTESQFTFLKREDVDYLVNITSWTILPNVSRGMSFNRNLSGYYLKIPSRTADVQQPQNITVIYNRANGNFRVSWMKSEKANEQNFTVVWCLSKTDASACQENIKYIELNSTARYLDLNLITSNHQYKFGVASMDVQRKLSEGIVWSRCIYWTIQSLQDLKRISEPTLEVQQVTGNSITLLSSTLKPRPDCPSYDRRPYVYGYLLRYVKCTTEHCTDEKRDMGSQDSINDWNHRLIDDYTNDIKVDKLEPSTYYMNHRLIDDYTNDIKVDKLEPSTYYMFLLTPLTAEGPGTRHAMKIITTGTLETSHVSAFNWIWIPVVIISTIVTAVAIGFIISVIRQIRSKISKIPITVPPERSIPHTSGSSNAPLLYRSESDESDDVHHDISERNGTVFGTEEQGSVSENQFSIPNSQVNAVFSTSINTTNLAPRNILPPARLPTTFIYPPFPDESLLPGLDGEPSAHIPGGDEAQREEISGLDLSPKLERTSPSRISKTEYCRVRNVSCTSAGQSSYESSRTNATDTFTLDSSYGEASRGQEVYSNSATPEENLTIDELNDQMRSHSSTLSVENQILPQIKCSELNTKSIRVLPDCDSTSTEEKSNRFSIQVNSSDFSYSRIGIDTPIQLLASAASDRIGSRRDSRNNCSEHNDVSGEGTNENNILSAFILPKIEQYDKTSTDVRVNTVILSNMNSELDGILSSNLKNLSSELLNNSFDIRVQLNTTVDMVEEEREDLGTSKIKTDTGIGTYMSADMQVVNQFLYKSSESIEHVIG